MPVCKRHIGHWLIGGSLFFRSGEFVEEDRDQDNDADHKKNTNHTDQ